ncbi:MAG: small ribosomal subunit Rsm22 family protein [Candidatus Sericytochromatia bacterium]
MILPDYIKEILEDKVKNNKLKDILSTREELTYKYKNNKNFDKIINSEKQVIAYILSRLPATFSVVLNILKKFDFSECESLLDLGSGPGTAILASVELLHSLRKISAVEHEVSFIKQFKEFISKSDNRVLKDTIFYNKDILDIDTISSHDLVISSYVLNELSSEKQIYFINKIFTKADKYIILIEPGTPTGYKNIITARDILISLGLSIIAPCPHDNKCPLSSEDWCHFYQRIERTSYQKYLKIGQESYEDEKYSYIIASKHPIDNSSNSRIIRHPQIHKGHIDFTLCTKQGIENITISKKNQNYKMFKKKDWGDLLN